MTKRFIGKSWPIKDYGAEFVLQCTRAVNCIISQTTSSYGDDYCGHDDADDNGQDDVDSNDNDNNDDNDDDDNDDGANDDDDDDDGNNITAEVNEGNYRSKCDFGEQSRREHKQC